MAENLVIFAGILSILFPASAFRFWLQDHWGWGFLPGRAASICVIAVTLFCCWAAMNVLDALGAGDETIRVALIIFWVVDFVFNVAAGVLLFRATR
jgi:hypothetical protein